MKKKRFPFVKVTLIVVSLIAIGIVYYELKFFDMMIGAFNLEKSNRKVVRVSKKALIYMMRSNEPEEVFLSEMENMGWTYFNTYGRGYLFTKGGEEILATKSKCFGRYTVFEIHNERYFNYMNGES
jgi:hypothetical protein